MKLYLKLPTPGGGTFCATHSKLLSVTWHWSCTNVSTQHKPQTFAILESNYSCPLYLLNPTHYFRPHWPQGFRGYRGPASNMHCAARLCPIHHWESHVCWSSLWSTFDAFCRKQGDRTALIHLDLLIWEVSFDFFPSQRPPPATLPFLHNLEDRVFPSWNTVKGIRLHQLRKVQGREGVGVHLFTVLLNLILHTYFGEQARVQQVTQCFPTPISEGFWALHLITLMQFSSVFLFYKWKTQGGWRHCKSTAEWWKQNWFWLRQVSPAHKWLKS